MNKLTYICKALCVDCGVAHDLGHYREPKSEPFRTIVLCNPCVEKREEKGILTVKKILKWHGDKSIIGLAVLLTDALNDELDIESCKKEILKYNGEE